MTGKPIPDYPLAAVQRALQDAKESGCLVELLLPHCSGSDSRGGLFLELPSLKILCKTSWKRLNVPGREDVLIYEGQTFRGISGVVSLDVLPPDTLCSMNATRPEDYDLQLTVPRNAFGVPRTETAQATLVLGLNYNTESPLRLLDLFPGPLGGPCTRRRTDNTLPESFAVSVARKAGLQRAILVG